MPSLAGRPPYATDERDSAYERVQPARQRPQQRKPVPQESNRDTTYAAYDHYFNDSDDNTPDRRSGIDAVGQGFMNAFMGNDSDSEDEQPTNQPKKSPLSQSALPASGKRDPPPALQPARRPSDKEKSPPPAYTETKAPPPAVLRPARRVAVTEISAPVIQRKLTETPPPARPDVRSPPPLAAPRPSRPTDLRAIQHPPPGIASSSPQPRLGMPQPHPANAITRGGIPQPIAVPSPTLSPTEKFGIPTAPLELNAPLSPITPVFLRRPSKPSTPRPMSVKFATKGGIMRGNTEDTLLSRSTEKNDFWRRFSMVMKDDSSIGGKKESAWLSKTKSSGRNMNRIIWAVAIVLLLAIGGGVGLGWYFTHNKPSSSAPVAIGGSANDGVVSSTKSSAKPSTSGVSSKSGGRVSATLTLSDRSLPTAFLNILEPPRGPFDSLPVNPNTNHDEIASHRQRRRALNNRLT